MLGIESPIESLNPESRGEDGSAGAGVLIVTLVGIDDTVSANVVRVYAYTMYVLAIRKLNNGGIGN